MQVFDQKAAKAAGGPTRVENAKIALIQFHISPPKTDLENNVIISDYAQVQSCTTTRGNRILFPSFNGLAMANMYIRCPQHDCVWYIGRACSLTCHAEWLMAYTAWMNLNLEAGGASLI